MDIPGWWWFFMYLPFYPCFQPEDMQQQIIRETFHLVSKRDDNVCNFLEGGRYLTLLTGHSPFTFSISFELITSGSLYVTGSCLYLLFDLSVWSAARITSSFTGTMLLCILFSASILRKVNWGSSTWFKYVCTMWQVSLWAQSGAVLCVRAQRLSLTPF